MTTDFQCIDTMFCSNQLGNSHQMDLSGPGIDVKLKEKEKERKKIHDEKIFLH
jgi:hypothetical protein